MDAFTALISLLLPLGAMYAIIYIRRRYRTRIAINAVERYVKQQECWRKVRFFRKAGDAYGACRARVLGVSLLSPAFSEVVVLFTIQHENTIPYEDEPNDDTEGEKNIIYHFLLDDKNFEILEIDKYDFKSKCFQQWVR